MFLLEGVPNNASPIGSGGALAAAVTALLVAGSGFRPEDTWWRRMIGGPRVLSTILHEFGHALMAYLLGFLVKEIRVKSVDTGVMEYAGAVWPFSILVSLAGYSTPPLAGLGVAALIADGKSRLALGLTIVVLVLVLRVSRDFRTRAYVLVVGITVFAVANWGSHELRQWCAYVEAWLLLLCEIVGLWGFRVGDGRALFRKTLIPGPVWVLGWLALNGWALWHAVPLLWP
jgi:peptidase M50B-like protein